MGCGYTANVERPTSPKPVIGSAAAKNLAAGNLDVCGQGEVLQSNQIVTWRNYTYGNRFNYLPIAVAATRRCPGQLSLAELG